MWLVCLQPVCLSDSQLLAPSDFAGLRNYFGQYNAIADTIAKTEIKPKL